MKFSTALVTLVALSLSASFAASVDWDGYRKCANNKGGGGEECDDIYEITGPMITDCINEVYEVCQPGPSMDRDTIDEFCSKWEKNGCRTVTLSTIGEIFPKCKSIPNDILTEKDSLTDTDIKSLIDMTIAFNNFQCSKDESGNYCPYVEFSFELELDGDGGDDEAELEKKAVDAINETCKSKSCTDAFVKSQSFVNNKLLMKRNLILDPKLTDDEKYEKILEFLKSDECISQHGKAATTEDSVVKKPKRKCIVKNGL